MSTLLIIGGTGFFGKSILDVFQRGGLARWGIERVIAMSRHATRLRDEAPWLVAERVELLCADIAQVDALPAADFVIHAAASTDARKYKEQPAQERRNIEAGIDNYCRLAGRYHASSKIVYASSGAVYGTQPADLEGVPEDFISDDQERIPEEKREYVYGKRAAEDAVRQLGAQGLSISIARCFAFVGPWLPRDQHFAIGNFLNDGLHGRPVTVKASKQVYRSYMHADDLVEWLMTIAAHAGPECPCYNVGSEQAVLMGELAHVVAKQFDVPVSVAAITDADIDRYVPSTRKAARELGLHLTRDLQTAVAESILSVRQAEVNKLKAGR